MEQGDPLFWYMLDPQRKALVYAWLDCQGKDNIDAAKQNSQKKPGHKTPQWMQAGSENFMPDLE